jgi:arylformamidase
MFDVDMEKHRVVDVTLKMVPGEGDRRLALRRYTFEVDGSFGNEVDTVTHLGTHVEAPAHYDEGGQDVTAYPPEFFMGPMVHLRFSEIEPNGEIDGAMMAEATEEISLQDKIAVVSTPHFRHDPRTDRRAVLTYEATKYLVDSGIKVMGFDDSVTIDVSAELAQKTHRVLFDNGVLIIEYMGHLDALRKKESYLIALPLRVVGFDSSPVRAIVIEERDPSPMSRPRAEGAPCCAEQ